MCRPGDGLIIDLMTGIIIDEFNRLSEKTKPTEELSSRKAIDGWVHLIWEQVEKSGFEAAALGRKEATNPEVTR